MNRKIISLVLLVLLVLPVTQVLAGNNSEAALGYLMEKYNVPIDQIQLFEAGILTLEQLGESFWFAKYDIYPQGTRSSGEVKPLPADTPVSDRGELIDIMPADDGTIYGGLYINEKSGEILDQKEMEPLMVEDRRLAKEEWERLSREAGKLDVSLYQKLKTIVAGETVSVIIFPAFSETQELRDRFEALKDSYPEFTARLSSLSEMFQGGYVRALPEPRIHPEIIEGAEPIEAIDEENGASSPPNPGIVPAPDDEYWQRSVAFYEELNALHVEGLHPAIMNITATLERMGAAYENEDAMMVAAKLNAGQIEELAALTAVASIHEDAIYTILPMSEEARTAVPVVDIAVDGAASAKPSLLWFLIFAFTLSALFAFMRSSRIKTQ